MHFRFTHVRKREVRTPCALSLDMTNAEAGLDSTGKRASGPHQEDVDHSAQAREGSQGGSGWLLMLQVIETHKETK